MAFAGETEKIQEKKPLHGIGNAVQDSRLYFRNAVNKSCPVFCLKLQFSNLFVPLLIFLLMLSCPVMYDEK